MLAFAGADAPSGLWHSIASAIDAAPARDARPDDPIADLPPLRMPEVPFVARTAVDEVPVEASSSDPADGVPAPVVDLAAARSARSTTMRILAGIAAAAVVVVAVLGVEITRQSRQVDQLTAALDRSAVESAAAIAARTPGARTTEMRASIGGRSASVILLPDGTGYVTRSNLERLPAGRTYQLWALVGDPEDPTAISAGVLGASPGTVPFRYSGPAFGFAVTDEARPGVVSSDQAPVVVGTF